MINRFEDEYPETRIPIPITSPHVAEEVTDLSQGSPSESIDLTGHDGYTSDNDHVHVEAPVSDDEDGVRRPVLSRHNSDVSLASRALSEEEGRMHRFGQKFRRDISKPDTEDHLQGTNADEQPKHLQMLRAMVAGLGGEEIRARVQMIGDDHLLDDMSNEASILKKELQAQDPEGWEVFVQSQRAAQRNIQVDVGPSSPLSGSAISD